MRTMPLEQPPSSTVLQLLRRSLERDPSREKGQARRPAQDARPQQQPAERSAEQSDPDSRCPQGRHSLTPQGWRHWSGRSAATAPFAATPTAAAAATGGRPDTAVAPAPAGCWRHSRPTTGGEPRPSEPGPADHTARTPEPRGEAPRPRKGLGTGASSAARGAPLQDPMLLQTRNASVGGPAKTLKALDESGRLDGRITTFLTRRVRGTSVPKGRGQRTPMPGVGSGPTCAAGHGPMRRAPQLWRASSQPRGVLSTTLPDHESMSRKTTEARNKEQQELSSSRVP